MKISKIEIENFRLLEKISINIEEDIAIIVGKNNAGKTSLFEIIHLFFNEKNRISFHDFSLNNQACLKNAFRFIKINYLPETEEVQRVKNIYHKLTTS